MTEDRKDSDQVPRDSVDELLLTCLKLDAVRSLTAGAAHNYNNIFGGLLGQFALIMRGDLNGEERQTASRLIDELLQRGIWISTKLSQFSRKSSDSINDVSPGVVLRDVVKILGMLSSSHRVIDRIEEDLPELQCIQHELLLVLFYLGRYAIAAMPDGGTVVFSARLGADSGNPAPSVIFDIGYQGERIPEEQRQLFFDPAHARMNLEENRSGAPSLFLVKHFVDKHGGTITFWDDPKTGNTFTVSLPGAQRKEEENALAEKNLPTEIAPVKSEPEVILLVEDEEAMRFLITSSLQRAGHIVFSVETGQEAIEEYAQLHDTITVIVMDVGLTDTTGPQCARRLLEIDPVVAVIYVSGVLLDEDQLYPAASSLLLKPFLPSQLEDAIRNVNKK